MTEFEPSHLKPSEKENLKPVLGSKICQLMLIFSALISLVES
jgi:hypothetical protein